MRANIKHMFVFLFRIHGSLCATYESASTRRFQSGRVDSIRASHPEALTWVKSMVGDDEQKEANNRVKQRSLFMMAIAKQTQVGNVKFIWNRYVNLLYMKYNKHHYIILF